MMDCTGAAREHVVTQLQDAVCYRWEDLPTDRHDMVIEAGEVLHLPANVPHSAEALEETLVLDIFSPTSEKTGIG